MTPVGIFISAILTYTFFAFIMSLISSAMLKKEQDPFAKEMENIDNQ